MSTVIDTGIGIPDETLEKIFDPFVQADTSVTRRLAAPDWDWPSAGDLSEALGGELTVQSELGKGSVFTFTIDTGPLDDVRILTVDQMTHEPAQDHDRPHDPGPAAGGPRPRR